MEEKRKEPFSEEPVSAIRDAPPPYSEQPASYPGAVGQTPYGYDQQLPPQGYPAAQPYPTQQYPPPPQQYGYPAQPAQGYNATVVVQQPPPVQPVRVNMSYS